MARKLGFKPSMREQQQASVAAQKWLALGAPPEKQAAAQARIAEQEAKIKPKRERAAPRQLEAPVVAAISELLAVHPRVIWAARMNSGMASYEAKSGKYAPVHFHKIVREPEPTRMPDFIGLIEFGRPVLQVRPLAIEAKAPGWTKPRDDREREQAAFLKMVRDCGGVGIFATDASQVAEALK